MLGAGGVGKSSLTVRFTSGYFDEIYDPTVQDSYRQTFSFDGRDVILDITDTAGQEDYIV